MIQILYEFTCDQCGKTITLPPENDHEPNPEGWAKVENGNYLSDGKVFHFSSYRCYNKYDKEHPEAIDCKASFYYMEGWWKGK